jgi:hypothetical protein
VALSRARSAAGLRVIDFDRTKIRAHDEVRRFYEVHGCQTHTSALVSLCACLRMYACMSAYVCVCACVCVCECVCPCVCVCVCVCAWDGTGIYCLGTS